MEPTKGAEMPAPKTDENKPKTNPEPEPESKTNSEPESKTDPEPKTGEAGEGYEEEPDPIKELRELIGSVREELAGVREDMGSLRGIVDGVRGQLELGASIAAEGNPGESEEDEDYPEIDLEEIARMTGDM